jgi:hypothetical protein
VSALYLYAVLGEAPAGALGTGLAGERLRLVAGGGVFAAAGDVEAPPSPTPEAVRAHDAVVRHLVALADAVLPARFGTVASDDAALSERLTRAGDGLREALRRVAGREQMILRVYDAATPREASGAPAREDAGAAAAGGPGTRYLAERVRAQRVSAQAHELGPIRAALDRFVSAERVERHETPPLRASVYHLVPRGAAASYTAAVEEAASALAGVRVTVSGPWAPYAFAPDALG